MSDSASENQRALKQAEQVLKERERLFRAVWEYAFDAMALSIPDGTVLAANPAYFHLYGFPEEEVVGKHFSIIFPAEQRKVAHELQLSAHRLLVPFTEPMAASASLNPVITLFHTTAKE